MAGGGLTDILRAKIKANLKTEVKDAYDQTLKDMDEVIHLEGNDKRETDIPNPEINKMKEVMSMHGDIEDNYELYEETLFQSFFKLIYTIEFELAMEIQELVYKIT